MAPDCDETGECPPDQKGARFGPLHIGLPLSIRREFARDWKRKHERAAPKAEAEAVARG